MLDSSSDCNAKGEPASYPRSSVGVMLINLNHIVFTLSPINGNRESSITMRLVVTISNKPAIPSESDPVGPSQALEHENPTPVALTAPDEQPNLEDQGEDATKGTSTSSVEAKPRLALSLDQPPGDQVLKSTSPVAELTSMLSDLEGFVNTPDLSVEVVDTYVQAQ